SFFDAFHDRFDFKYDLSLILFGLDDKSGNQDGHSSFMAITNNRNQSNPLAIVGNQKQQITSYMQNNISSQTAANVPGGSSTQVTVSLSSSDDDIDIRAILSRFEGNDCSPMPNNANNNRQQQIAANQQHGMVCSGSDDDDLWIITQNAHTAVVNWGVIPHPNNAIIPIQMQHCYQMLDVISSKPNIGQQGIRHNIK
nr:hypothetical protein [Tanacetum cinerariifolium]